MLLALVMRTDAAEFLTAGQVNATELESKLLSELASVLRPGSTDDRIPRLEGDLYQLFTSVPSESDGTLNHHVVRYILHRFFVQKHGWFILGLEPDGDHRDDSSEEAHALTDLQEWVPTYLQGFLEQLNKGKGLSLREVAVFAATLEDLIHKEAVDRLELAWRSLDYEIDRQLFNFEVRKVMETYMIVFNVGGKFDAKTPEQVEERLQYFDKNVKDWNNTQWWLRKVTNEVFPYGGRIRLNFSQASYLVEEIGERFGAFNDADCGKLKQELLGIESSKRIGRVPLTDFYKKGLYSAWEFNEKKEYLISMGALDESDPKYPSVLIPNYIASRSNCLIASNFYSVCCRNECEDLMTKIEAEVRGHSAKPQDLLRLLPKLRTSTIKTHRKLSEMLMDRLHEVAIVSGGKVPIHSRLFAQWMHHAFPRDCPYPHEAGTTSPQTPDEWMNSAGHQSHRASASEMKDHVELSEVADHGPEETELPWSDSEDFNLELLSRKKVVAVKRRTWRGIFSKLAMFVVIGAMVLWLRPTWSSLYSDVTRTYGVKSHYA